MIKKISAILFILIILFVSGCNSSVENTSSSTERSCTISYCYDYTNMPYPLPDDLKRKLETFCESGNYTVADPIVSEYLDIPQNKNQATGTDPICIVLPDLDLSKYKGPYFSSSDNGEFQIETYYRVFAGMPTDEKICIFISPDGAIKKYETINYAKYDKLTQSELEIKQLQEQFHNVIDTSTQPYLLELSENLIMPCAYSLYIDNMGQLIIKTTASFHDGINGKGDSVESKLSSDELTVYYYVDLYAKLDFNTNL